MIATGPTLARALWLAVEVETLAAQYWRVLQIGGPTLLTGAEIAVVQEKFDSYGLQPRRAGDITSPSGRRRSYGRPR